MHRVMMTAALFALALVLLATAAVAWQLARDPLDALPRVASEAKPQVVEGGRAQGREWRRVRLELDGHGPVEIQISLPDPPPARPLPLVFVLGGLYTGAQSVRHLPEAGDNVLVGYDWPIPRRVPRELAAVQTLSDTLRRLLFVPAEVSAALRWTTAQPWTDRDRVTLVGLSLGALAAPAVQRMAATEGIAIGWTVLGYGGAPLGDVAAHHPRVQSEWLRPLLRPAAAVLLRPLEPALHLPHLEGSFLVLGGTEDELIPEHAAQRFAALTPEPKRVEWIEGIHLGTRGDRQTLLAEVIGRTVEWLREQEAVEPAETVLSGRPM